MSDEEVRVVALQQAVLFCFREPNARPIDVAKRFVEYIRTGE